MSVTSFLKPILDQVIIVDATDQVWASWAWVARNWYQDTFKSVVKSALTSGYPNAEVSNLPFWFERNGALAGTLTIWRVGGRRELIPLDVAFDDTQWGAQPEVISKGSYPIRGQSSGTFNFTVDIDSGGNITVDVSAAITGGGELIDIVHALNSNGPFSAVAVAFVAGIGDAAQLGIRSNTAAASGEVEVITGLTDDCSELLGFTLDKENLYAKGDYPETIGTFNQSVDLKQTQT